MPKKTVDKYKDEKLKKDCIPKDNQTREQMIELFVIENIDNPEKFEFGPPVNKNNDPIYIPEDFPLEA